MEVILIKEKSIKIGQLLKLSGAIMTGGEARAFLEENDVFLNGEVIKQRGKQVFDGDILTIGSKKMLVKTEK